jgi:hypothetical protein
MIISSQLTWLAMFLYSVSSSSSKSGSQGQRLTWTKTSPGLQLMMTLSGTRESAHPIQRNSGACWGGEIG